MKTTSCRKSAQTNALQGKGEEFGQAERSASCHRQGTVRGNRAQGCHCGGARWQDGRWGETKWRLGGDKMAAAGGRMAAEGDKMVVVGGARWRLEGTKWRLGQQNGSCRRQDGGWEGQNGSGFVVPPGHGCCGCHIHKANPGISNGFCMNTCFHTDTKHQGVLKATDSPVVVVQLLVPWLG